jgi:hypothetical protein
MSDIPLQKLRRVLPFGIGKGNERDVESILRPVSNIQCQVPRATVKKFG